MKNILCQNAKHTGLSAFAPQQPVWSTFATLGMSSIRGSESNYDARIPGSFIEGDGYA